jgi:hypothetical protein
MSAAVSTVTQTKAFEEDIALHSALTDIHLLRSEMKWDVTFARRCPRPCLAATIRNGRLQWTQETSYGLTHAPQVRWTDGSSPMILKVTVVQGEAGHSLLPYSWDSLQTFVLWCTHPEIHAEYDLWIKVLLLYLRVRLSILICNTVTATVLQAADMFRSGADLRLSSAVAAKGQNKLLISTEKLKWSQPPFLYANGINNSPTD